MSAPRPSIWRRAGQALVRTFTDPLMFFFMIVPPLLLGLIGARAWSVFLFYATGFLFGYAFADRDCRGPLLPPEEG